MCLVCPLDVFRLLSKCASSSISSGNITLKEISELIFIFAYQLVYVFFFGVRHFAPLLFHNTFSYHNVLFVFV